MEYYSAIKMSKFESVLGSWIQSEVSQEKKNKYLILMHIYMKPRKMVRINLFAGQE